MGKADGTKFGCLGVDLPVFCHIKIFFEYSSPEESYPVLLPFYGAYLPILGVLETSSKPNSPNSSRHQDSRSPRTVRTTVFP